MTWTFTRHDHVLDQRVSPTRTTSGSCRGSPPRTRRGCRALNRMSGQNVQCSAATWTACRVVTGGAATLSSSVLNPSPMTRAPNRSSQLRRTADSGAVHSLWLRAPCQPTAVSASAPRPTAARPSGRPRVRGRGRSGRPPCPGRRAAPRRGRGRGSAARRGEVVQVLVGRLLGEVGPHLVHERVGVVVGDLADRLRRDLAGRPGLVGLVHQQRPQPGPVVLARSAAHSSAPTGSSLSQNAGRRSGRRCG